MFKVCHAVSVLQIYSSIRLVQKSPKSVSLSDILSSLAPTSLSEHLTTLRRDITTHFIEFILTQPLSITQTRSTDDSPASIEHRLELFPAPPNSATLVSRLDNLSGVLEFLNAHLFGAIPFSQRAAFLKSFSKPLTSGVLNHLLIPALPASLSELPEYLKLLERAVKFENEELTRILYGPISGIPASTETGTENEISSWVGGIVSHYQRERRVGILDQARKMFTDVSSDWHGTFQVEWTAVSVVPALGVNGSAFPDSYPASELPSAADYPSAPLHNGTGDDIKEAEVEQVDDEGWGFGVSEDGTAKEPQNGNSSSSFTGPGSHIPDEVDNDAWGWNDEGSEPAPVSEPEPPNEPKGNGNENAEGDTGGDDPLWDAWDDPPPSPPTKKVVPKPATKLEKLSSKGKQGANPPKIATQPLEPKHIPVPANVSTRANPNNLPALAASTSFSSSWSSSSSPTSQQFLSIPPTPASATTHKKVPKEFYTVSSGMQDILELVESVMLESSEFSRSTLLAAYLPAPNSASSASGSMPGSVILNTIPSILDLFRALYPMTLLLGPEGGNGSQKVTETSSKRAIQFSNDCLYLEERIRELLPALSSGPSKTPAMVPPHVWTIDYGFSGKMEDAGKRVKIYGESWFAKTIVRYLSSPFYFFLWFLIFLVIVRRDS